MKRQIRKVGMIAISLATLYACTNDDEYKDENEPRDLKIQTSISLARSYIDGTAFTKDTLLAVYANNTTSNNKSNNYAVYKYSGTAWEFNGSDKIQLTAEDATIYAHYPAGGTYVITHSSAAVNGNSTLAIGLFEGSTSADDGNKIFVASDNKANINAAKGEVDFMYSAKDDGTHPTANNGKKSGGKATDHTVTLTMRHALSMVSFRVYNDKTYTHTGSLTKIQLKNKDSNTTLNKGTSATMKLGDGGITISGAATAATFTRFIYTGTSGSSTEGFTLGKFDNANAAKEQTPAFSMLVYPDNTDNKSTIEAIFTVDGTEYPVALPTSGQAWGKGKNYIYTVKLNGKELGLGTVSIVAWEASEIGAELIPVV